MGYCYSLHVVLKISGFGKIQIHAVYSQIKGASFAFILPNDFEHKLYQKVADFDVQLTVIFEVILIDFILGLLPLEIANNLILVLFNLIFELEYRFEVRLSLFGFGIIIDWRSDNIEPVSYFLHISLDFFLVVAGFVVDFGFGVYRLPGFVLIARLDHQLFWLIIC